MIEFRREAVCTRVDNGGGEEIGRIAYDQDDGEYYFVPDGEYQYTSSDLKVIGNQVELQNDTIFNKISE